MASQYKTLLLDLTGDAAMARKLDAMAHGVGSTIARRAIAAAIRTIGKAQKDAAPKTGFKRGIGWRVGKNKNTLMQDAKAGLGVAKSMRHRLASGKQRGFSDMYRQGHLLILGTKNRWTGATTRAKGKGNRGKLISTGNVRAFRGHIDPDPTRWLKHATERALPSAIAAASKSAWDAIEREVSKG